jgi:hypothetical protein
MVIAFAELRLKSCERMSLEDFPPPLPSESSRLGLRTAVAAFLNFALVLFVASVAVSLASDSLILFLKNDALAGVAGFLAVPSFFTVLVVYGLMAVTPLVPKRIFLPLTWSGPAAALMALPVMIYGFHHSAWIAWGSSLGQFLLCLVILHGRRGSWGFRWPLLAVSQLGKDTFRWRNSIGFVAVHLLVVLPVVIVYLLACGSLAVSYFTDGFVSLRPSGVTMQVRKYSREDGKTVELVAMSHIGEPEFYQSLAATFPPTATVLMEGVSDEGKLMPEKVGYTKTARDLGLAEQHEVFKLQGELVSADVDIGQFSKVTLDCLKRTMVIHAKGLTAETLPLLMQPSPADLPQHLFDDLLRRRNEHLLAVLRERLLTSDHLIIPWGAAHMPGISAGVLKAGFRLQNTQESTAIRFGGVKSR